MLSQLLTPILFLITTPQTEIVLVCPTDGAINVREDSLCSAPEAQ